MRVEYINLLYVGGRNGTRAYCNEIYYFSMIIKILEQGTVIVIVLFYNESIHKGQWCEVAL
jgi:hypothetical protein